MDASKYEYKSEFARRYFGEGNAAGVAEGKVAGVEQGKAQGRVEILLKQLATRYGALSAAVEAHIRDTSAADLDAIAVRVLTAETLDETLGTG